MKNSNIERLRIIASFGIICFHSQTGLLKLIGYAGLPIFIMITFSLGTIKNVPSMSETNSAIFRRYLLSKIDRLIKPYIFWVFVYWIWGILRALSSHGGVINVPVSVLLPLYGTSIHLWYLPFVFIALTIISFIKLYCSLEKTVLFFLYLLLSFITGILSIFLKDVNQLLIPLPQFIFAMPAVFIGLIVSDTINPNKLLRYGLALLVISLIGSIRLIFDSNDLFLFLYLPSFALVVTLQNIPGQIDKLTDRFSPLTFGIYLIHPIFIAIIANILTITKLQSITPLSPIIIFIISGSFIFLLKQTRIKKYI